jgi:hypothetical protein
MAVDIKKLIAAINPGAYCKKDKAKEVKEIAKNLIKEGKKNAYLKAAEKAELVDSDYMDFDAVIATPFALKGLKNPLEKHTLSYDDLGQNLEPIYYWIHDYLYNQAEYGKADKLVDNFVSAPGSTHFSEMGMKATKMQEEAMKMLGSANTLIKSILNIVYDLKEFEMRLANYDDLKSDDKSRKETAKLSLKQIWLDTVDIKRGNTSVKGLALGGQAQFITLIDAFMAADSLEHIVKKPEEGGLDLNERVKRILASRYAEYEKWIELSEKELRKRFEVEKIYLKSQVNSIKLYARWAKPYLKAAQQLEQRASSTSALVTAFNVSLFELGLLGIADSPLMRDISLGDLPKTFKTISKRKYLPVVLVELNFRSVPERGERGYGFRGKSEITFSSFALNEDEIKVLKEQVERDDLKDALGLIEGATDESLALIEDDLNRFLEEKKEKKEEKKNTEDTNPFSALFSIFSDIGSLFKKEEKKPENKNGEINLEIAPDSDAEKVIRSQALIEARRKCRKFYDAFKKSRNMFSVPM